MIKKVSIQTAGSNEPVREGFVLTEETTAQELLNRARLNGYLLCPSENDLPLGERELLYPKVADNQVLFAYREATAGASAPVVPGLLQQRGWTVDGKWWHGYFRTRFGAFQGKVRKRLLHAGDFYVRFPPEALKSHPKWACFNRSGDGWYSVHFNSRPDTIEDGIKSLEALLSAAFKLSSNTEAA